MEYSRITSDDIPQIIDYTQRFLTNGEEIREEIELSVEEGNYFGIKATDGKEIVGFLTIKKGVQFTVPHPGLEREIRRITNPGCVYYVDGIWVSEDYRHHGISCGLVKRTGSFVKQLGGDYIFIEEWIYPDGHIPVKDVISKWGTPVYEKEVPLFYKDMKKYGMTCPICGSNCKCGALIRLYSVKDIAEEGSTGEN